MEFLVATQSLLVTWHNLVRLPAWWNINRSINQYNQSIKSESSSYFQCPPTRIVRFSTECPSQHPGALFSAESHRPLCHRCTDKLRGDLPVQRSAPRCRPCSVWLKWWIAWGTRQHTPNWRIGQSQKKEKEKRKAQELLRIYFWSWSRTIRTTISHLDIVTFNSICIIFHTLMVLSINTIFFLSTSSSENKRFGKKWGLPQITVKQYMLHHLFWTNLDSSYTQHISFTAQFHIMTVGRHITKKEKERKAGSMRVLCFRF